MMATVAEDETDALIAVFAINKVLKDVFPKRKKKRVWCKKLLLKRESLSHTSTILRELDADDFRNYLRMDEATYEYLLSLVSEKLTKNNTRLRSAITPHERLSATLRFLATGRNYTDMQYSTAISQPSMTNIVPETCRIIYDVLQSEYLKFPSSENEWEDITKQYENLWDFPNCLGSIDGKHVRIISPPGSGAYYRNYKGFDSMVLLAVVDANYKFTLVDFGTNGRVSDGGVIEKTKFYDQLKARNLKIPECRANRVVIPERVLRYVFVGDEAFALRTDFIKPFNAKGLTREQRIFNYRLSRCRRVVENVFGILASRFQVFLKAINLNLENIHSVVMACCVLHNFLRTMCASEYTPRDSFYSENTAAGTSNAGLSTEQELISVKIGPSRNASEEAKAVRSVFMDYFNNEGAVPWQDLYV